MYSNTTAVRTTRRKRAMSRRQTGLGILEHDLQNDVSRVAAAVNDLLEQIVNVAQEDDVLGIIIAVVKIAQQLKLQLVSVALDALQPVVFLSRAGRVDAFAQIFHHLEHTFSGLV